MSVQSDENAPVSVSSLRDQGVAAVEAMATSTQEAVSFAATRSKEAVISATKEAQRRVEYAKDAVLERGAEVAGKLQALADEDLRDTMPGRVIGSVAETVSHAADTLRGQDLRGLWNSTTDYARRNPAMFLAGAALTGFAIARFARATSQRSDTAMITDAAPRKPAAATHAKTRPAAIGTAKTTSKPRAPRKAMPSKTEAGKTAS